MTQSSWQYCCVGDRDRSFAGIGLGDLLRLAELAADAEAELFARDPVGSGWYTGRLLTRPLCQGAALHYVDMRNSVKDFDVWSFYAQHDDWPFPAWWRGTRDFGPSKFGRYPGDPRRRGRLTYRGRGHRWSQKSGQDWRDLPVLTCRSLTGRPPRRRSLASSSSPSSR
jgi:hypothetical protein